MRIKFLITIAVVLCAFIYSGCGTSVKRVKVDEQIDLSGRWNDTDSQLVSREIIDDCLRQFWLKEFQSRGGQKPVVIVGSVANNSSEHINSDIFIKDLERELTNSREVKFVASASERPEIRAERDNQQQGFTNPQTIKKIGLETGADFMLIGSINSIKDEVRGRYAIFYQVNMELIDLENNEKVWIGQKQLKKIVKKSKFSL